MHSIVQYPDIVKGLGILNRSSKWHKWCNINTCNNNSRAISHKLLEDYLFVIWLINLSTKMLIWLTNLLIGRLTDEQILYFLLKFSIQINLTSTAKQVLGNCERMVLANFLGNMLSTFILWLWLSSCTLNLCTVVLCC